MLNEERRGVYKGKDAVRRITVEAMTSGHQRRKAHRQKWDFLKESQSTITVEREGGRGEGRGKVEVR